MMSYEDLEKVKAERAAKETARERKKAEKGAKKAEKATAGKSTHSRKRKHPVAAAVDVSEPIGKVPRTSEVSEPVGLRMDWLREEQQIAPVARMI